jgi:NosR/NirI family nitrous oxide reductase transcriptional regulator
MEARATAALLALAALVCVLTCAPRSALADIDEGVRIQLDCSIHPCAEVLPGATRFEKDQPAAAYFSGYDGDELKGWVVLSTDVVDIKAYSGKPLVILVGVTHDAMIGGAKVLHHSEPILLVGIPEKKLHDFAASYAGMKVTTQVVIGKSAEPNAVTVDLISGATVTVLAGNKTILDTARALGAATGVVKVEPAIPGHFVNDKRLWDWQRMVQHNVFGRLSLSEAKMGVKGGDGAFIDLYFTIADAPHIGIPLLGRHEYEYLVKQLKPGQHMLVIYGNGSGTFKGSGFVRGGQFDRVRVEQGLRTLIFSDHDYHIQSGPRDIGAPGFKEAAVFFTQPDQLDPGAPFDLIFLASRYDGRGGFSRDFWATKSTFQLPKSMYVLDGPDPSEVLWRSAWYNHRHTALLLGLFLGAVALLFASRRWLTADSRRLERIHVASMVLSFGFLGIYLKAQPSVTQVLTFTGSVVGQWQWSTFLTEPLLFVSWLFIAAVTFFWGRGVFCGWTCPYGAMSELLFKLGRLVRLPAFELPDKLHKPLRYLRYLILVLLVAAYLYSAELGERLAEVEPFKSTFFVRPWERQTFYFAYWVVLAVLATVWFRPFCRYLCPLGAALAIPSSVRASGPYRRAFCEQCKICTRICEPKAIGADGVIDPRECLSCMQCEANYQDKTVCPPLIGIERLLHKASEALPEAEQRKLSRLREGAKKS